MKFTNRCLTSFRFIFSLFALSLIIVAPAHAYIDPGSGSYLFQLLIAGLLGSLFAIKSFWHKIVAFVKRIFSKKK